MAVGIPIVAAAIPVWRGGRMTVREALRDPGSVEHFGHGRLDRVLARLRGLPRPTLLSIRNTFRRKVRLALTLAALAVGGMVFMTVFTVRDSLYATLDDTVRYFNYDVQVELTEPAKASTVVEEALAVPGVTVAEPWRFASAQRIRPDGSESPARVTFGLPDGATTVRPVVMQGRWLLPGEGNALVVTANLLGDEPDLADRRRGHAADRRPRHDLDAGRDRPVPDDGAVPVPRDAGPRAEPGRRRAGPGS